ncbi:MAG: hypothetical protein DRN81_02645 [Thermoproteota archaeon]|nr:MAG: hypothetical protein DRN81_02645 [Candidatus Korarchaeota archaeon]
MFVLKKKRAEIVQKSQIDTTALGTGVLNRAQANKFIDLIIENQRILNLITTKKVDNAKGQIDKINITTHVLRKQGSEGGEETETSSPNVSSVNYDCQTVVACFDLTTEAEEDNIEGKGFRKTLINGFSKAISNDLAKLVWEGDSSLGSSTAEEKLLRTFDGIHIKTQSCPNIVDANGTGVSLLLFKDLLAKLPKKYKTKGYKKNYRWLVSTNISEDMQYAYANRATPGGDSGWTGDLVLKPFGIIMEECPYLPEDLTIGTAATDGTFMLLADPKDNMILFVRRKITFHYDFRPRKGKTEVTIYMRLDFEIPNLDGMAKARSISCDSSTAYSG